MDYGLSLVTTANDIEVGGLPVQDAHYRYTFVNNKTKSNNGSGMKMNLLIILQACHAYEKRNYNYTKANHALEMILKKRQVH